MSAAITAIMQAAIDTVAGAIDLIVIGKDNAATRQKAKGAARPLRKIR
jgi:hypothetical protein